MCISVGPAEFSRTVIADFPEVMGNENRRVVSYMNTAESIGTSSHLGTADAGPNAMIFPIYGEVTGIPEVAQPDASRDWLDGQRGVYSELWDDGLPKMRGGGLSFGFGMGSVHTSGNYMVGIAENIEDIPATLHQLREASPRPEHVPEAPDKVLANMDAFYRSQALGVPQFVIAAFALSPRQVEDKNPVTIQYTRAENMDGKVVFPALDYHGTGEFEDWVTRDHTLLFSTEAIAGEFEPLMMEKSTGARPSEFSSAPIQFPLQIRDVRKSGQGPAAAPNNDYIFDVTGIAKTIGSISPQLRDAAAKTAKQGNDWRLNQMSEIGRLMANALGPAGLMQYSNQAATTAAEYAASGGWGRTLDMGNM